MKKYTITFKTGQVQKLEGNIAFFNDESSRLPMIKEHAIYLNAKEVQSIIEQAPPFKNEGSSI